jgi:hypothetical protein
VLESRIIAPMLKSIPHVRAFGMGMGKIMGLS